LRVLDARPQLPARPDVVRALEGVECVAVRAVADRMDRDGETTLGRTDDRFRELVAARDLDAGAVEHARGLRAERAVHERLDIPEAEQVVAERAVQWEREERVELVLRMRLPDAQREVALVREPLENAERTEPAVLVVDGGHAARGRELPSSAPLPATSRRSASRVRGASVRARRAPPPPRRARAPRRATACPRAGSAAARAPTSGSAHGRR